MSRTAATQENARTVSRIQNDIFGNYPDGIDALRIGENGPLENGDALSSVYVFYFELGIDGREGGPDGRTATFRDGQFRPRSGPFFLSSAAF